MMSTETDTITEAKQMDGISFGGVATDITTLGSGAWLYGATEVLSV